MSRTTIRLDEPLAARVRSAAVQAGRGLSGFIRETLLERLESADSTESLLQRAKRFGLVGVVGDAPTDLSRNKNYFDGFGKGSGRGQDL